MESSRRGYRSRLESGEPVMVPWVRVPHSPPRQTGVCKTA